MQEASSIKTPKMSWRRKVLFSLLPVTALLLFGELSVRVLELGDPHLVSSPLPEQFAELIIPDRELFWRLRPNLDTEYHGAQIHVNGAGFRGRDVDWKREGEFRILSLGESTTFGVGVGDEETYTARLAKELAKTDPAHTYSALNVGVSAYSSFQSWTFLKLYGDTIDPDVVLFYHELNDYLPASLRDFGATEYDACLTDRQRYASRGHRLNRTLMQYSALYRTVVYWVARVQIDALRDRDIGVSWEGIGLSDEDYVPARRLLSNGDQMEDALINERALTPRVTPEERTAILLDVLDYCQARDIALVLIHPSYRDSQPHECELTVFATEHQVPMFDAQPWLHPPDVSSEEMFIDFAHPTRRGHRLLAEGIAEFLQANSLVPQPPAAARSDE